MKAIFAFFFSFFFLLKVDGQTNLVQNGNFEYYDTCPNTASQIRFAVPWFQPNTGGSSTDYWNVCGGTAPYNFAGFQVPKSGNGYGGFSAFCWPTDSACHEYLEVELADSLLLSKKYCVSAFVSLSNMSNVATSSLGCYLSSDSCLYNSGYYSANPVVPQLILDTTDYLSDTLNWSLIKWTYLAQGGEHFITIGNFFNPPNIHFICLRNPCGGCYYYIDDVSVVELPELESGNDTVIVQGDTANLIGTISQTWLGMQFEWLPHNGLSNPYSLTTYATPNTTTTYTLTVNCPSCDVPCLSDLSDSMTVFVEPISPPQTFPFHVPTLLYSDQLFMIDSIVPGTRIKLYDIRGRKIFESNNYNNDFSVANLSTANYVYEVTLPDERIYKGKFCVVKR